MTAPLSEADLLRQLQLDASPRGVRLLRNNVGAFRDGRGVVIRYGVGGVGGSDLIGWQSIIVTPEMVGQLFARFIAIEGKRAPRNATEDQQRFLDAVRMAGGLAGVAYDVADLARLLESA